ncbi:ArdC-like ssDNA-binding domain-containing protein [Companilactobacillus halodurans]|uniref:N-terminal domain-containing protein n=1 Tax=Companilactobacillus halodurans TaxID=2584183 RepID=A0A5P0ZZ70_9LACO|nr:ArdC-like ssDNA-binding domain-containing protein [Companilactobacillus halodurans]MQS98349.1 hypothetical protein [Companilactobacillus halodurans]
MPSKADVKAWKAQLVAQAEQQILKLTDSDRFKQYLNTLAKFHHYSARNIDLIYAQNPQATQVAGFKQWQTAFNRTVKRGAKAIRIAAPIIKKLTPAEQKHLDTTDERAIVGYRYLPVFDVAQTSGEPVLSAKDFVKENLADHQNVTSLYNAFKDYLNQQTDLKAVIHSALSEIQQVSNKVIELSDGLTKQLGLQEAQKEPEHNLKKLSAHDLNKSYQGLQQQVQQATSPQQKAQLKNQLNDVHQEISDRTQKQLKAFAEENPEIKQPDPEYDQSLKR